MKKEVILERLKATGIRQEEETVVPVEGAIVTPPYQIIRTEESDAWYGGGRLGIRTTMWTVTLFTVNKDFALERKIRKALAGVGEVAIKRYPDGEPYAVDFTFTTKGAI